MEDQVLIDLLAAMTATKDHLRMLASRSRGKEADRLTHKADGMDVAIGFVEDAPGISARTRRP